MLKNNPIESIKKKFYIESYGCQMNLSDSQIIASILSKEGFGTTQDPKQADLILLNTCSIREKAEQTIYNRLKTFNSVKKKKPSLLIGILGCMAERLKHKLLEEEKIVDLVAGPDAYRDIPNLIKSVDGGTKAINVLLSKEETYGDISPVRLGDNGVSAFVSITRGCDNMCTFCVVPFTRGRERSRDPYTIVKECKELYSNGYKEVTLLGQNVDSYLWYGGGLKKDFINCSDMEKMASVDFSDLLELVAKAVPTMRIRFSTSNPYDISKKVLNKIAHYPNICKHIHLPVQSGSNKILKLMNRKHTKEEYITLIDTIRKIIPDCAISHDMITGFCNETKEDHLETLGLMEYVKYEFGYMFYYSPRPGTLAYKKFIDDVPLEVKKHRLDEIITLQRKHSYYRLSEQIGTIKEVLIEKSSKKDPSFWQGRTPQNTMVVFPKKNYKPSEFVKVKIHSHTSATLIGDVVSK